MPPLFGDDDDGDDDDGDDDDGEQVGHDSKSWNISLGK